MLDELERGARHKTPVARGRGLRAPPLGLPCGEQDAADGRVARRGPDGVPRQLACDGALAPAGIRIAQRTHGLAHALGCRPRVHVVRPRSSGEGRAALAPVAREPLEEPAPRARELSTDLVWPIALLESPDRQPPQRLLVHVTLPNLHAQAAGAVGGGLVSAR